MIRVEARKPRERGLRPAGRRRGGKDEQVAVPDFEVMVAYEGGGGEAEGPVGSLFRGEAGKLAGAYDNDLADTALTEEEV